MKLAQVLAKKNFDTTEILGKKVFIDLETLPKHLFSTCHVKNCCVVKQMVCGLMAK
jgi:hypothetical protein